MQRSSSETELRKLCVFEGEFQRQSSKPSTSSSSAAAARGSPRRRKRRGWAAASCCSKRTRSSAAARRGRSARCRSPTRRTSSARGIQDTPQAHFEDLELLAGQVRAARQPGAAPHARRQHDRHVRVAARARPRVRRARCRSRRTASTACTSCCPTRAPFPITWGATAAGSAWISALETRAEQLIVENGRVAGRARARTGPAQQPSFARAAAWCSARATTAAGAS